MTKRTIAEKVIAHTASRFVSLFAGLLAAFLILYSGYVIYDNFYTQNQAFSSTWELLQYRPEIIDDGTTPLSGSDLLAQINEDYRAWLTIYNTNIDYPVMQGENDLYYASHDIYGESSLTGAIYLSELNSPDFSDNYNIIYGHHMDNNAMFGQLDEYEKADFFNSHKEAVLVGSDAVYDLDIFAAMKTDAYDTMIYNAGNRDLSEIISYTDTNAMQKDMTAADGTEKIVVLSTCASADTNGRLVVFASMTERDENAVLPADEEDPAENRTDDNTDASEENENTDQNDSDRTPAGPIGSDSTDGQDGPKTPGGGNNDPEIIEDGETPLAQFVNKFQPTGGSHGFGAWSLVNLICMIITIYILVPILHLGAKFGRSGKMKKVNKAKEDDNYYEQKQFSRRFWIGILAETVISILAVMAFLHTEDLSLPMTLIDRWTPMMILILLACWLADICLVRYRKKTEENAEMDMTPVTN